MWIVLLCGCSPRQRKNARRGVGELHWCKQPVCHKQQEKRWTLGAVHSIAIKNSLLRETNWPFLGNLYAITNIYHLHNSYFIMTLRHLSGKTRSDGIFFFAEWKMKGWSTRHLVGDVNLSRVLLLCFACACVFSTALLLNAWLFVKYKTSCVCC